MTNAIHITGSRDPKSNGQISLVHPAESYGRQEGSPLSESERRFREMIDALPAAIYTTDAAGRITHFNPAAAAFAGRTPELGTDEWCVTWKLYYPDGRPMPHHECPMAIALREGREVRGAEAIAERPDGTRVWFTPYPTALRDDSGRIIGAINMLVDITERKEAERTLREQTYRLATLNRISRDISRKLDQDEIIHQIVDIATELCGAEFGAFFYNVKNEDGESYMLYALSGAPKEAFSKFPLPRNTPLFEPTFRGASVVRSADIRNDPRYGQAGPLHGMPKGHFPVASYLAVPVVSRSGEVHGGLFFGHREPGRFTEAMEDLIAGVAAHTAIALDNAKLFQAAQLEIDQRRRAEENKELLFREMKHRVKNTITLSQAIAVQTLDDDEKRVAFLSRLHALAEAQDLLTEENWDRAALREVARRALAPYQKTLGDRLQTNGPNTWLSADRALAMTLLFHELATNAAKYGALSNGKGSVRVTWDVSEEPAQLNLCWQELEGPAVAPPRKKGFGSRLMERSVRGAGGNISVMFEPTGVICRVELPL
jgi:PAS domain S-box-containing protein